MKRTPIAQRGKHYAQRRGERFGEQAAHCRSLPCCACTWTGTRQTSPTEAHHEPPISHGGLDHDTVPLCRAHHRYRHDVVGDAEAFWSGLGLDLELVLTVVRERGGILPGAEGWTLPT